MAETRREITHHLRGNALLLGVDCDPSALATAHTLLADHHHRLAAEREQSTLSPALRASKPRPEPIVTGPEELPVQVEVAARASERAHGSRCVLVQGDMRGLPLRANSVTKVLVDVPYGLLHPIPRARPHLQVGPQGHDPLALASSLAGPGPAGRPGRELVTSEPGLDPQASSTVSVGCSRCLVLTERSIIISAGLTSPVECRY